MDWKATAHRAASIAPWTCIYLESAMRCQLQPTHLARLPWPASDGAAISPYRARLLKSLSEPRHLRPQFDSVLLRYSMFRLLWNVEANSAEIRQGPRIHRLPWAERPRLFLPGGGREIGRAACSV